MQSEDKTNPCKQPTSIKAFTGEKHSASIVENNIPQVTLPIAHNYSSSCCRNLHRPKNGTKEHIPNLYVRDKDATHITIDAITAAT